MSLSKLLLHKSFLIRVAGAQFCVMDVSTPGAKLTSEFHWASDITAVCGCKNANYLFIGDTAGVFSVLSISGLSTQLSPTQYSLKPAELARLLLPMSPVPSRRHASLPGRRLQPVRRVAGPGHQRCAGGHQAAATGGGRPLPAGLRFRHRAAG